MCACRVQSIHTAIRLNTVDRLKAIITGLNRDCDYHMPKSGKKQELIDRIRANLDEVFRLKQVDRWIAAKAVITSGIGSSGCVETAT